MLRRKRSLERTSNRLYCGRLLRLYNPDTCFPSRGSFTPGRKDPPDVISRVSGNLFLLVERKKEVLLRSPAKARFDWKSITLCHHDTLTEQNSNDSGQRQADNTNGGSEGAVERPYQTEAKSVNPQEVQLQLPFDGKCEIQTVVLIVQY